MKTQITFNDGTATKNVLEGSGLQVNIDRYGWVSIFDTNATSPTFNHVLEMYPMTVIKKIEYLQS